MRRLVPLVIRARALPLVVVALIAPSVLAFSVVGPQLGLAMGALTVAALIVYAARAVYDEPIEVARADDARYRLLVVAPAPIEEPRLIDEIAEIATEGQRLLEPHAEAEVLVVAPARSSRLDRWASDLGRARRAARRVVAISLGTLAAAGLDAAGRVGDPDPVQAVEDELHTFAAREVVLVDGSGLGAEQVEEVRRRLDRPVRRLAQHPTPSPSAARRSTG